MKIPKSGFYFSSFLPLFFSSSHVGDQERTFIIWFVSMRLTFNFKYSNVVELWFITKEKKGNRNSEEWSLLVKTYRSSKLLKGLYHLMVHQIHKKYTDVYLTLLLNLRSFRNIFGASQNTLQSNSLLTNQTNRRIIYRAFEMVAWIPHLCKAPLNFT